MKKLHHSVGVITYLKQSIGPMFLTGFLLAGMSIWMGSKGPLAVACAASLILIVRSIGLRLNISNLRFVPMAAALVTQLGPFAIYHSHHDESRHRKLHEFSFRGKLFCAGCYGMAIGTFLGLMLPLTHFFIQLNDNVYSVLALLAPLFFLPTIFRCFGWLSSSAVSRFIGYGLLPLGSWIILVQMDRCFQNTIVNLVALGLIVVAWHAGGKYKMSR